MKAKTYNYREAFRQDFDRIRRRNHSKDARRTSEQIEQSRRDHLEAFRRKWSGFLAGADTAAQRNYCRRILEAIDDARRI